MNGFQPPGPMGGQNPFFFNQMPMGPPRPGTYFPSQQPVQQPSGAPGFLSKLLGQAGSGYIGQTGGGSVNIESLLNNIQKTLKMAEQITPMIQQYGPLIKNAPAMLKLLREFNSNDDDSEHDDKGESSETSKKKAKRKTAKKEETKNKDSENKNDRPKKKKKEVVKESKPKLYI